MLCLGFGGWEEHLRIDTHPKLWAETLLKPQPDNRLFSFFPNLASLVYGVLRVPRLHLENPNCAQALVGTGNTAGLTPSLTRRSR